MSRAGKRAIEGIDGPAENIIERLWPLQGIEVEYIHAKAEGQDIGLTINVCGTFVRTNRTAPASLRISTSTALCSAYFPIHNAYP